jgi:type II secretory pathway pseudopilin PulG
MFELTALEVAAYGAVTGTIALVLSLVGRRDVTWSKRAKVASDLRLALRQLRDATTAARTDGARALRTPRVRGDLELVEQISGRAADRRLRSLLAVARERCALAANSGTGKYDESIAVETALKAINDALARIDKIDRKAPT